MIDLSALPAPDVVEDIDYEAIRGSLIADFVARWPEFSAWVESDPVLKLLEVAAYRVLLLHARVNDAARGCMLAHAEGGDLDNLVALLGVKRVNGELDDDLRHRARLSLGAHNTAGSAAAYEYWALQVPGVEHVCVNRTVAGEVRVVATGAIEGEGAAALDAQVSSAEVTALRAALNGETVRPIGDLLNVRGVEIKAYRVVASLTTARGVRDREAVRVVSESAIRAYCAERHRCHRPTDNDIHRSALIAAAHVPGVDSVTLTEPAADVALNGYQAGWPTAALAAGAVYGGGPTPGASPVRHPMSGITVTLA